MKEKRKSWSMMQPNPISRLMQKDEHLIPDHIREAMAAPPKGYLDAPRNQYREPAASHMFTTHIPACRADADLYLASLRYPHTRKEHLLRRAAEAPVPSLGGAYAVLVALTVSIIARATFEDVGRQTASDIALCSAFAFSGLMAVGVAYTLVTLWADRHLDEHFDAYHPGAPTKLMHDITERSIDVRHIDSRLASLAWDVYCYDAEHYDKLTELIRDMRDNPAERGTKTHRVYTEIIDAFRRASELRQDATRKALADNAEAIEQQRRDAVARSASDHRLADEMRADMLEATVLERLRAEASAAEDIYGSND